MSYQETIAYLFGLQKHGIKFGLSNSYTLMELMGNPHQRFRSVHIAGTNGKGSTAAFLASMLAADGYRVGLYTSPHLVSFTERIRVNGTPISEARVVELASEIRIRSAGLPAEEGGTAFSPTFFEVTTAMAFAYFAEKDADIVVVETGMGGRLDSTNVVTPLVSVITTIDIEHTEFLGETLEQISAEKAGIIKQGVPVVTGVAQPEALAVVRAAAARQGARLYGMPADFGPGDISTGMPQRFRYQGIDSSYDDLRITMRGRHQVGNASVALAAVECLRTRGFAVSEQAVRAGLEHAAWEGRLELVGRGPDVFLDGAHNPASAAVLAEALQDLRKGYRRCVLVIGILKDKDRRGILDRLLPLADLVVVTRPTYNRAMEVEALAAEVRSRNGHVVAEENLGAAIARGRQEAGPDGLVVVTGSLYTVGDARAALALGPSAGTLKGLKG